MAHTARTLLCSARTRRMLAAIAWGALCTVLVAWVAALFVPHQHFPDARGRRFLPGHALNIRWQVGVWETPVGRRYSSLILDTQGLDELGNATWPGEGEDDVSLTKEVRQHIASIEGQGLTGVVRCIEDRTGWPFVALAGKVFTARDDGSKPTHIATNGCILLQYGGSLAPALTRLLPLTPVWPGFVIDSLAFGLLIAMCAEITKWRAPSRPMLVAAADWLRTWRGIALLAAAAVLTCISSWIPQAWIPSAQWQQAFGVPTVGAAPKDRHYNWFCSLRDDYGGFRIESELQIAAEGGPRIQDPDYLDLLPGQSQAGSHARDVVLTDANPRSTRVENMYGLPLIAMRGYAQRRDTVSALIPNTAVNDGAPEDDPDSSAAPVKPVAEYDLHGGIPLSLIARSSFSESDFLPLIPVWPGFAFNTLLYAIVIGSVMGVVRLFLHQRRRKAGRCTRCAYGPLMSARCPECGTVQSTYGAPTNVESAPTK